jgi:hypothetical protein
MRTYDKLIATIPSGQAGHGLPPHSGQAVRLRAFGSASGTLSLQASG